MAAEPGAEVGATVEVGRSLVAVADIDHAISAIERSTGANPRACMTLGGLLRSTAVLPVTPGLIAESMAYSMLLPIVGGMVCFLLARNQVRRFSASLPRIPQGREAELSTEPAAVRAYVAGVEQLGYRHVLVYDHVVGADPNVHEGWNRPYDIETTFHEPLVLYGFLAAITSLELVTAHQGLVHEFG